MLSDRMLIDASYVAVNPSDNWLQLWLHWVRCRYGGCMQNKAPSSQNTCFWQKRPPTTAAMVSMANLWPSFEMREMKGFAGQNMVLYGYGSIPINTIFRGDEHPFTSYFDVHQGYKVLTHCHMVLACSCFIYLHYFGDNSGDGKHVCLSDGAGGMGRVGRHRGHKDWTWWCAARGGYAAFWLQH